jgi:hypothetical protein
MKTIKKISLGICKSLLEARKKGLYQYRNYLMNQLTFASGSTLRKCYEDYVKDQVEQNDRQLSSIESKLSRIQ